MKTKDPHNILLFISELSEDWATVKEPVLDGVTFYVKYLGSTLVEKPSGEEATADAIKTIILMVSLPEMNPMKMMKCCRPRSKTRSFVELL